MNRLIALLTVLALSSTGSALAKHHTGESDSANSNDDYMAEISDSGTIRFARERMPVKIYLFAADSVPGYKPEYELLVRQAFADWQAAAPGFLSFVYVPSPNQADITVAWTNDLAKMAGSGEGGHTMVIPNDSGIVKSVITILTADGNPNAPLDAHLLTHVVEHEIGHAIGISGHSPSAADIMYGGAMPADAPYRLSARDQHTILALYSATGAAVRPLSHTKSASESGPTGDQAPIMRLSEEGLAAMHAGNFSEAQGKFEQALKLEPTSFYVRQNMAALYCNMGAAAYTKKDMAAAESDYQQAIPLLDENPDKTQLKKVLNFYAVILRMNGKEAEAVKAEAQCK